MRTGVILDKTRKKQMNFHIKYKGIKLYGLSGANDIKGQQNSFLFS